MEIGNQGVPQLIDCVDSNNRDARQNLAQCNVAQKIWQRLSEIGERWKKRDLCAGFFTGLAEDVDFGEFKSILR